MLDPTDEVRAQPVGLARELHVGETRGDLLEDELQLHAREVGAEAEVVAAAAERDLRVGVALDVEREGIVEHVLVAVRRDVPHHDLRRLP